MIELLGIGVPRADGGWLLRGVCATLEAGEVTIVVSADVGRRGALLDAITGRRVPHESRVWVNRLPLMGPPRGASPIACSSWHEGVLVFNGPAERFDEERDARGVGALLR